jgi:hypothetical protein
MLALSLACASSLAARAVAANNSKGGDAAPVSSGLEDGFVEVEKIRLHVVRGGAGSQTVVYGLP